MKGSHGRQEINLSLYFLLGGAAPVMSDLSGFRLPANAFCYNTIVLVNAMCTSLTPLRRRRVADASK